MDNSKGEAAPGEDLLTRAQIEFEEEVGLRPESFQGWMELGSIKQKGGKIVHAWAFEAICQNRSRSNQICSKWNGHWARVGSKVF